MKITKIAILNFLGISSFKTNTLGKLNRITGGNGAGKSSVLKAITEAFQSSGVDPHVIKVGADKAEILVELDNKVLVERQITPTANRPKVVVDGQPLNAPQKFLNDLFGRFAFNPVAFFLAKPKERRQILLSSIPLLLEKATMDKLLDDFVAPIDLDKFDYEGHGLEVLERIQADVYDRRHEQNQHVTRLMKALEQDKLDIPETFDGDKYAGFNLQEKIDQLTVAKGAIDRHETDLVRLETLRATAIRVKDDITRVEAELKRLKAEQVEVQTKGKELAEKVKAFDAPDITALASDIDGYKDNLKLIHKLDDIQHKQTELEEQQVIHGELDGFYKALMTTVPRKLLSGAQLPVDNLEIKGDRILVDGKVIDKLSSSEQIQFAINIARALAGELKVICVDRFETLDKAARAAFEKEVSQDEFEYFITEVTDGDLTVKTTGVQSAAQCFPRSLSTTEGPHPAA